MELKVLVLTTSVTCGYMYTKDPILNID